MKTRLFTALFVCSVIVACGVSLEGCKPYNYGGGNDTTTSSGALQVVPSATTVGVNQNISFQVSGGVPPYTYQVNGVGSIDGYGNYQPGSNAGQAEILISDSSGDNGSASVSVIASASNPFSVAPSFAQRADGSLTATAKGWQSASSAQLKASPLARGTLVAEDRHTNSDGDEIRSRYLQTDFGKHPLVRMDEKIEGHQVVAARAIIEDQFLVKLQPGYSEQDLNDRAAKAGAHISKSLSPSDDTYLVSLDRPGDQPAGANQAAVNPTLLSHRAQVKKDLQGIATVTPNYITRQPATADSP